MEHHDQFTSVSVFKVIYFQTNQLCKKLRKTLISRLTLKSSISAVNLHTSSDLLFRNTPILFAEPLKKKKKLDPAIVKQREERKRKKLEKQIRRLEKNARQLKPIDELEVPLNLIDEKNVRTRHLPVLTAEEQERRILLNKKWAAYKNQEKLSDYKLLDKLVNAQNKALEELRFESEELYQEAIQIDPALVPFKAVGPVSTPPIKSYESPDGDYTDISKKWE